MSKHEKPERHSEGGGDKHVSSQQNEHGRAGDRLRAEAHQVVSDSQGGSGRRGGERTADTSPQGDYRKLAPPALTAAELKGTAREDGKHIDVPPIKKVIRHRDGSDGDNERADSAAGKGRLDARQSVQAHVDSGAFRVQEAKAAGDRQARAQEKVEGSDRVKEVDERTQPVEKVKVEFQNQANDPADRISRADFIVRKDGSVVVVNNPDKNNKKELVIEVERDQGQVSGPSEAQQKAIDELAQYCADRYMRAKPDGSKDGVIEDQQGLVSDRVKAQARTRPEPEMSLPEPTRHRVEDMRRFSSGGRGTMTPDQVDGYFTPRDQVVPRRPEETNQQWAVKEMVAGMANVRDAHPYEATRNMGDRGVGVGRYVLTYEMIMDWLNELIGDPPDPAKLAEAIRKGKISPKMAEAIKSGKFQQFMEKMKNGEAPSPDEIKDMLPKEAQERIAEDLIAKFSQAAKDENGDVDIGKVALAMQIGRMPTDEEAARPEFKAFEEAAERLYSFSQFRTDRPTSNLEWQEVNGKLLIAAKEAVGERVWARSGYSGALLEYGNLGCAASVSQIIREAGVDGGRSASVTTLESQILKNGGYRVSNPQPGDIVIGLNGGGRSAGGSGHIGIVGENGSVYHNSSSKRSWVQANLRSVFGRFQDVHYIRLPNNNGTTQV